MSSILRQHWPALSFFIASHVRAQLFSEGGITILSQNHLDGSPNNAINGSGALLLSQRRSFTESIAACENLGEYPWTYASLSGPEHKFTDGLNNSLSGLVFDGQVTADQLFWVSRAPGHDPMCRTIDPRGNIHQTDCEAEFPTICTQSAPVSNSSFSDTSVNWQIIQQVGNNTQFTGYRDAHIWKFRGIRYAKKPERFGYSQLYIENGNISAITAGADCVQPIGEVTSGSSEDCLFLNIWTPYLPPTIATNITSQLKPVMVYLYGGGFQSGSGKNPNTDGTNLASRGDVVVISVNYRVGNIGFLAFNDGVHNGNYGISDMVTALEWVRRYIQYFGGDASRVTVFGESAGAEGTHILLASPKAKGLFHRAIMQSDPTGYANGTTFDWIQYAAIDDAFKDKTTKVLEEAGCLNATDHIACLGEINGFDLVNLTTNVNAAVVDGTYLQYHELVVNSTGIASNISVMTGTNRDEVGVFIDANAYPKNGTSFSEYFTNNVGSSLGLPSNYSLYVPLEPFSVTTNNSTPERIFNASLAIATDGGFTCFDLAKAYSGAKNEAFKVVYAFQFNRTYSPSGYTRTWCDAPKTETRPHGDPDGEYYKCHGGEQLIMFGNALRAGQPDRDGFDVPYMQLIVDYWGAFGRTGDPNPDPAYLASRGYYSSLAQVKLTGKWDPVNATDPTLRLLQWNGAQIPFVQSEQCKALGIPFDILET